MPAYRSNLLMATSSFAELKVSCPAPPYSSSTLAKLEADYDFQLLWQEKILLMLTELQPGEAAEITIIEGYLPSQMSDAEMVTAITNAIDKLDASCIKDMGRTMSALKATYSGRMDFSKASNIVKERLTSLQ